MTEAEDKESAGPLPVLVEASAPQRRPLMALLALLFASVALIVMAAGAYFVWERLQQLEAAQQSFVSTAALAERLAPLNQANSDVRKSLAALDARVGSADQSLVDVQQRTGEIADAQEEVRQRLAKLDVETQAKQGEWLRAEAAYLVQLAIARVELQRDVDGSLEALRLADQLLARLNSSAITERQAVHRAINRLVEVDLPDISRLAGRLEGMISRIDILPLDQQLALQDAAVPQEPEALSAHPSWQERWDRAWQRFTDTLGSLVVVQQREPVEPLLLPEERYFLYHNLRLQLEAARLALIEGDASIYQRSLDRAGDWIQRYYALGEPGVESMLAEITALRAVEIRPELPPLADLLKPVSGG